MECRKEELLATHTTMKLGGPAEFFCIATSTEAITKSVRHAYRDDKKVTIVGGGSNIVFADEGIEGYVVQIASKGIEIVDDSSVHTIIKVAAGEEWDAFVAHVVEHGLYGLETLSGIPGTVGAAPIQNIGAYGTEVHEYIYQVEIYDPILDELRLLSNDECDFGYRESIFKNELQHTVVTNVLFKLAKHGEPRITYKDIRAYFDNEEREPTIRSVREAVLQIRNSKFPNLDDVGTSGSFFKNPIVSASHAEYLVQLYPDMPRYTMTEQTVKIPLAWILDNVLHMKGYRKGNFSLHSFQPLILVHHGEGTVSELKEFVTSIEKKVFDKTKIKIEDEVLFL